MFRRLFGFTLFSIIGILLVGVAYSTTTIYPGELGPYPVGRTSIIVSDEARADRQLVVDILYPAIDSGEGPSVYDLLVTGLPSTVALDNPQTAEGVFPLVAYSHGSNGIRYQSIFLTEHLASHGFVVVAPDHAGNSLGDILNPNPSPFQLVDRPLDISLVIDQILEFNEAPDSAFFGLIDSENIAAIGHSLGGFTSLALASGFGEAALDKRIKAVVPMAPAATPLSDEQLSSITIPSLILGSTLDQTTPNPINADRIFAIQQSLPRWQINIIGGGHSSFSDACLFFDILKDFPLPAPLLASLKSNAEEACGPELIDIEVAQNLTNLYTTAFLKLFLQDSQDDGRFLTSEFAKTEDLPVEFNLRISN